MLTPAAKLLSEFRTSRLLRSVLYSGGLVLAAALALIADEASSVRKLQKDIDAIQRAQRTYGEISVKQPDIWGQARLMQQRFEFETNMAAEIVGSFSNRFQGRRTETLSTISQIQLRGSTGIGADGQNAKGAQSDGSNSSGSGGSGGGTPGGGSAVDSTLERSEYLNQKADDLNYLHAIRRINEGDDTADSPGYALYLARLPVSVTPGAKTKKGFGAEIEFHVEPVITPNLLSSVFKSLVVNDLVQQLAQPIAELAATNTLESWEARVRKTKALNQLTIQTNIAENWTNIAVSVSNIATRVIEIQNHLVTLDQHSRLTVSANELTKISNRLFNGMSEFATASAALEEFSREATNKVFAALAFYSSMTNAGYEGLKIRDELKTLAEGIPQKLTTIKEHFDQWQNIAPYDDLVALIRFLTDPERLRKEKGFAGIGNTPIADVLKQTEVQPHLQAVANALDGQSRMRQHFDEAKTTASSLSTDVKHLRERTEKLTQVLNILPNNNETTSLISGAKALAEKVQNLTNNMASLDSEFKSALSSLQAADPNALQRSKDTEKVSLLFTNLSSFLTNEVARISLEVGRVLSTNKTDDRETIRRSLATQMTPFRSRNAQFAFPSTYIPDVYGEDELMSLVASIPFSDLSYGQGGSTSAAASARLLTALPYLKEQLDTAYEIAYTVLESKPKYIPDLIESVRHLKLKEVQGFRTNYYKTNHGFANVLNETNIPAAVILSWPAFVQIVLLNDHLNTEMNRLMREWPKTEPLQDVLRYYEKVPSSTAFLVFSNYVANRWPIRVFALGPQTRDQNIKDSGDRQREFQAALSTAFLAGKINASQYASYSRKYGWSAETVKLNRTAASFARGGDRFGWTFFPRFQTGNSAFGRDSELEPGTRECEAILIVPSFVQEVHLTSNQRWIEFDNLQKSYPSFDETAQLSQRYDRLIYNLETSSIQDQRYRDNIANAARAIRRLTGYEQLTMRVPHENSLGGFAIFNSSSAGLAPELSGYFGSPIFSTNENTSLFLVGNNFSVRGTRVIAAGRVVPNVTLLSRQLMQVELSPKILEARQIVDVYVATPYGVTRPLSISVQGERDGGTPMKANSSDVLARGPSGTNSVGEASSAGK